MNRNQTGVRKGRAAADHAEVADGEWFPGEGGSADDEAFLAELRACADARGLVDATPDDTILHAWEGTLVVLVAAPRLRHRPEQPTLEVIVQFGREPTTLCSGWETYGYLTDSCEPMDLAGVDLEPRALARHAFEWFEAELRRPLECVTWRTWRGERSVVRYADTGAPVWTYIPTRFRDRRPDVIAWLR
jgi:hypothetical protein